MNATTKAISANAAVSPFVVIKGSHREMYLAMYKKELEKTVCKLKAFSQEMMDNPFHAFQWADSSFEMAGKNNVMQQVIHLLEAGESLEDIRATLTDNIMHGTRYIPSSTSRCSNYVKMCQTAAQADVLHQLSNCPGLDLATH